MAGCCGGLALLMELAASTQAGSAEAAHPSQPIKMIVPYPAGGTTDFLGRLVAEQLRTGPGATVVVENKPGAATAPGADQVARAEADGYTLLMATSTTLAIDKTLYSKLPYDPVRDFAPIALVAGVPFALVVNPRCRRQRFRNSSLTPNRIRGSLMVQPAMAVIVRNSGAELE